MTYELSHIMDILFSYLYARVGLSKKNAVYMTKMVYENVLVNKINELRIANIHDVLLELLSEKIPEYNNLEDYRKFNENNDKININNYKDKQYHYKCFVKQFPLVALYMDYNLHSEIMKSDITDDQKFKIVILSTNKERINFISRHVCKLTDIDLYTIGNFSKFLRNELRPDDMKTRATLNKILETIDEQYIIQTLKKILLFEYVLNFSQELPTLTENRMKTSLATIVLRLESMSTNIEDHREMENNVLDMLANVGDIIHYNIFEETQNKLFDIFTENITNDDVVAEYIFYICEFESRIGININIK